MTIHGQSREDIIKNAELVKVLVLEALVIEEFLTEEQAKEFCETYGITIHEGGMFRKLYSITSGENLPLRYEVVCKV